MNRIVQLPVCAMESLLRGGAKVYDVNTKQEGVMTSDPYVPDSGTRQVADVAWLNGERSVVFTEHIRAYA